jgi:prevent-host-death family protein
MTNMTYTRSTPMSKAMTIAEAKAHFSECVKSAEGGETVLITRYGRAAAAVVSAKYLAELEASMRKGPAQQGLAALVGRFPDGAELTSEVDRIVRARGAPRKTPRLR